MIFTSKTGSIFARRCMLYNFCTTEKHVKFIIPFDIYSSTPINILYRFFHLRYRFTYTFSVVITI